MKIAKSKNDLSSKWCFLYLFLVSRHLYPTRYKGPAPYGAQGNAGALPQQDPHWGNFIINSELIIFIIKLVE